MDNDDGKRPLLLRMVNDSDDLKFMLVLKYQLSSWNASICFCIVDNLIVCDGVGQLYVHLSVEWHMQMQIMIVSSFTFRF